MNTMLISKPAPLAALVALALAAGMAQAAPKAAAVDAARLQYERDRADCLQGRSAQPRETCLKEAGAAYAEARRRGAGAGRDDAAVYAANAAKRCDVQKGEMRELCLRRVNGEGQVSGSVAGGGQLRELRTTDNPPPPPPPPQR